MDLISTLPHTNIYYVGVGSAEGSFVNDQTELNQQYPQFFGKYPSLSKTLILIDPKLEKPTYAETHLLVDTEIVYQSDNCVTYVKDGIVNNIILMRSAEIIRLLPSGDGYSEETLDFVSRLVEFVLSENALLFYHDFTGHFLVPFYQIYDPVNLHDHIMFSITTRTEDGCFTKWSPLCDIEIDESLMHIRNPWSHDIKDIVKEHKNATGTYRIQLAQRIYCELMDLKQLSYDVDYAHRKDHDDDRSIYIRSIVPIDTITELHELYDNVATRSIAQARLFDLFKARFDLIKSLIPDIIVNIPAVYDVRGARASSYCTTLLECFKKTIDFTHCHHYH